MRNLIVLLLLSFLLAGSSFAKEPVGDWQTVQNDIPRGWQITVVTSFTFPCIFEQPNDKELVCEQLHHRWVPRIMTHMYCGVVFVKSGLRSARARICWPALLVAALLELYWVR
jgi:hypothetical protein